MPSVHLTVYRAVKMISKKSLNVLTIANHRMGWKYEHFGHSPPAAILPRRRRHRMIGAGLVFPTTTSKRE
jgi:hypothetical protein